MIRSCLSGESRGSWKRLRIGKAVKQRRPLDALGAPVKRSGENELETEPLLGTPDEPIVALLAPPTR